ncbi:MAG: SUMF1/EgtB/PvdO family nonheme iron enzyme, partial [Verrucomicrobium sp.]
MARVLPQFTEWALLGTGGMGAVYKARQISLDRWVAIKILPPEVADGDPLFTARFKNEARAIARLSHPAIVAVYDSGETAEGQMYFVMEYVDGTDVGRLIAQQWQLSPEHALTIASAVCDALQCAHEQGVIHRDIKPANVLLNGKGEVKVVDFGLAKLSDSTRTSQLTQSRMTLGTPDYVAPEVFARDKTPDHRADLYSLGVMLYHMLTGEVPRGMFKLPSVKVGANARFDAIITRAMENDPQGRYQHASEMRQALGRIRLVPQKSPSLSTSPGGNAPSRGAWVPAAVLLALFTVAGIAWYVTFHASPSADGQGAGTSATLVPPPSSASSPFAGVTKDKPLVNTLGQEFVPVPGTQVLFSRWETRVKDYRQFATETQRTWPSPPFEQGDDHPAVCVSWLDATLFCEWLSQKEKRLYRLPTDREWSFAAGIGELEPSEGTPVTKVTPLAELFPWGRSWPIPPNAGNYADESAMRLAKKLERQIYRGYEDGFPYTSPVGTFPANAFGLYDLSGNVWEWCFDWVDSRQERRVLRGGSYESFYPDSLWSSHRGSNSPWPRRYSYGFRIVLSNEAASPPRPADPIPNLVPLPASSQRVKSGTSEYQFISGRVTWAAAQQQAIQMGGHLAVITSKEEEEAVVGFVAQIMANPDDMAWLGATRVVSPSGWQWVTGEPFEFTAWDADSPSSDAVGD